MAKFTGRLSKAPVVYALCQIRFPIVGTLNDALIDSLHAPLRGDYPHRFTEEAIEFSMSGQSPVPSARRRYSFLDRQKRSGYLIDSTMLAYRTTAYLDFEHFIEQTLRGLKLIFEVLKPAVIDRVGMRYVDLIECSDDEELEIYIEPPLHGFKPNVPGFTPMVSQQLVRGMTDVGQLIFRSSRAQHASALPADLQDPNLIVKVPQGTKQSVVIDVDHFKENADQDADLEGIRKLLGDLQAPMSTLFKDAVTDMAIKKWNT